MKAAELLRKGDVASGMQQILGATQASTPSAMPGASMQALGGCAGCGALNQGGLAAAPGGIDPERLKLAQTVGALRLQAIQEAAQQQYMAAYAQQLAEAQQLQEQQQEVAQLALIMEAAEAQAAVSQQSLEEEQQLGQRGRRGAAVCGNWQRGHCGRGESCQFAHPDKGRGANGTSRGAADIMRHNFKTSLCKFFAAGNCPQGARCMFAHGPADLRSPGMNLKKEEEEIVLKVAATKGNPKSGSAAAAASTAPVAAPGRMAPAVVLPPGGLPGSSATSADQQLLTQLLLAQASGAGLAGLLGAAAPPRPVAIAEQQQIDPSLLMTLASLAGQGGQPSPLLAANGGAAASTAGAPSPLLPSLPQLANMPAATMAGVSAVGGASLGGSSSQAPPAFDPAALQLLLQSQMSADTERATKRARFGDT